MHFNVITNDHLNYKDVGIIVKFKGIDGKEDKGGDPVWCFVDACNYYIARANPLEINIKK